MKRTIRLTESDLHRVIKESVKRIISKSNLVTIAEQANNEAENQLRNVVRAYVNEALVENVLTNEGRFRDFWDKISWHAILVLWLTIGSAGILGMGYGGHQLYSRDKTIKQCRKEFVSRYNVDPDTLQPGDERLKEFGLYTIEKLKGKNLDTDWDYLHANSKMPVKTFYDH